MSRLIVLCTLFAAGAGWFYVFITAPERVYGSKALDCSPFDVTWTSEGFGKTLISGCGQTTEARCIDDRCMSPNDTADF